MRRLIEAASYAPVTRFNAVHGEGRLLFTRADGTHLDLFIDSFRLCHELPLSPRLEIDAETVSLADLFLTKLQVATLNKKDVSDAAALLLDHHLTPDDSGINLPYITRLLAHDWGWWRTATESLVTLRGHVERLRLGSGELARVQERLGAIEAGVDAVPKSLKWRARARVGDRMVWREDPEEAC